MTYSRSCGVSLAACGAIECRCVSVDPEPVNGPEKPVQRFEVIPEVVHAPPVKPSTTATRFRPPTKGAGLMPDTDMITTSTGTNIWITTREATGDRIVVLDNPAAPDDMRRTEAGRVLDGGFQPAPFAAFGLTTETLRAIADLIEREATR